MLAQPAASSTTAMASQQCFIIRIAFLLPGSGVAARVATPRSSVLARDRDVACAAGGRDAAVGQRYRRDQGGACAPAFAQGGDEALPRFALCDPRLRSQVGAPRRQEAQIGRAEGREKGDK